MTRDIVFGALVGYAAFGALLMAWCHSARRRRGQRQTVFQLAVGVVTWPIILLFILLRAYKVANR